VYKRQAKNIYDNWKGSGGGINHTGLTGGTNPTGPAEGGNVYPTPGNVPPFTGGAVGGNVY
jgi:hypothetical protein